MIRILTTEGDLITAFGITEPVLRRAHQAGAVLLYTDEAGYDTQIDTTTIRHYWLVGGAHRPLPATVVILLICRIAPHSSRNEIASHRAWAGIGNWATPPPPAAFTAALNELVDKRLIGSRTRNTYALTAAGAAEARSAAERYLANRRNP